MLCAAAVAPGVLHAQTAPAGTAALPPGLAALLAAQSMWSVSTTAEASYGYKDNLLLSQSGEERSAFGRGSVSLLVLRASTGRFDYSLFGQVDGTRYFAGRTVDHDAKAWAQTEFGYRPVESLKLAVPVTGYYSDQVFDVSDTDVERLVAELKVTGVMVGPLARWSFLPQWWVEAQAVGERKRYDDGSNDGKVGEEAFRLGWRPSDRLELRGATIRRWRNFDRRAGYTAAGRELAGTHLKIAEQEYELRVDVTWDAAGRWKTMTRAAILDYRDNGSGYFNFRDQKFGQEVEWKGEDWFVRLTGMAKRIDFHVQTVGFGIDPPPRIKDEYLVELRVERRLGRAWTALAEFSWERTRSNDLIASYAVNEGLLGLRWSWEK